MPEAKIYATHRYSLGVNVVVSIVGALLIGGLLSYLVFALLALASVVLFFFAYLGEEKSYPATSGLGAAEAIYSAYIFAAKPSIHPTPTLLYGAALVVVGLLAMLRYRRSRAEGKKALSDFVPPAFG